MIQKGILFLSLYLCCATLYGQQCGRNDLQPIQDPPSEVLSGNTFYPLHIGSIGSDNLSTNPLKFVRIHFTHTKIADIEIRLISPNGQEVKLVGPVGLNGSPTIYVDWNVTFVRCSAGANPDNDFDVKWKNNNEWRPGTDLKSKVYDGVYHPSIGCLEEIDRGSITGTWMLRIIDKFRNGSADFIHPKTNDPMSAIKGFSLSFQDDAGLNCKGCVSSASSLTSPDIKECKGSDKLLYNLKYTLDENRTGLRYGYIVSDASGSIIASATGSQVDLRTANGGDYTVQGIHFYNDDYGRLSKVSKVSDLNALISSGEVCAKLSKNKQNVSVLELEATVSLSKPFFDCNTKKITATIAKKSGYTYTWGEGVKLDAEDNAVFNRPGKYSLSFSNGTCTNTKIVDVKATTDYAFVETVGKDIWCSPVKLEIKTTPVVANINWFKDNNLIAEKTSNINVKEGGTYKVKIVTSPSCTIEEEITVVDKSPKIESNLNSLKILTCKDSVQTARVTGVTLKDYTVTWKRDGKTVGSKLIYGISTPGTYTVTIEGKNGENKACKKEFIQKVESNKEYFDITIEGRDITCKDSGRITLEATPVPNKIVWKNAKGDMVGNGSEVVTRKAGDYTVDVISKEGCRSTKVYTLNEITDGPRLRIVSPQYIDCDSPRNKILDLMEGVSYVITLPNGKEVNTIPYPDIVGTYGIVATSNETGCTTRESIVVNTDDNSVTKLNFKIDTFSCRNQSPKINILDGNDWIYRWDDPRVSKQSPTIFTVVEPGMYTLKTIKKGNPSCVIDYALNVVADTTTTLDKLYADDINCFNDSVKINIDTDYSFESFKWSPAQHISIDSTGATYAKEGNETYTITYTFNENGCRGSDTIRVVSYSNIPKIKLTKSADTIKCNDTIDVSITTGLALKNIAKIEWLDSANNVISMGTDSLFQIESPGKYKVVVEGKDMCFDTSDVFQIYGDTISPRFALEKSTDIFCNADTSKLYPTNIVNGGSYQWRNGTDSIATDSLLVVTKAGTYTLDVINTKNNCVTSKIKEVLDKRKFPDVNVVRDTTLTCRDTVLNILAQSNDAMLKYSWTDSLGSSMSNKQNIDIRNTGRYFVFVTNDQECITTDSVLVSIDTVAPVYTVSFLDSITCSNTQVKLSVPELVKGWEVDWNKGASKDSIHVTDKSNNTVSVTGANGCVTTKEFSIKVDTQRIVIDSIYSGELTCKTPIVLLRVASKDSIVSYSWTGVTDIQKHKESPTISHGGTYTCTVTGVNGCKTTGSYYLSDSGKNPYIRARDVFTRCDGAPTAFVIDSINGVSEVIWSGVTNKNFYKKGMNVSAIQAGIYIVEGYSKDGCPALPDTFNLKDSIVLPEFSGYADDFTCQGSTLYAIDVKDDESFVWKGPYNFESKEDTVHIDSLGAYRLIVTSIYGCNDTLVVSPKNDVRILPKIDTIQQSVPFQCNTMSVNLKTRASNIPRERLKFSWKTTDGKITTDSKKDSIYISAAGMYTVVVTDTLSGCKQSATISIEEVKQSFTSFQMDVVSPSCINFNDGVIKVSDFDGNFPPYRVIVDEQQYGVVDTVGNLFVGEYVVTVVDSLNCMVSDTVMVTNPTEVKINLPSDTLVLYGSIISIDSVINPNKSLYNKIEWSDNVDCRDCTDLKYTAAQQEIVTLRIESARGCKASKSMEIRILQPDALIPNAFSPNGDGNNDVYVIPKSIAFKSVDRLLVTNYKGDIMYDENNVKMYDADASEAMGWDGIVNNSRAAVGRYLVFVDVTLIDGTKRRYIDTLTLTR